MNHYGIIGFVLLDYRDLWEDIYNTTHIQHNYTQTKSIWPCDIYQSDKYVTNSSGTLYTCNENIKICVRTDFLNFIKFSRNHLSNLNFEPKYAITFDLSLTLK